MNYRPILFVTLVALALGAALAQSPAGLVTLESANDVDTTQSKLEAALEEAGLMLVLVIDHAENAAGAGLELLPTRLVIFGNPEAGTPLMQRARSVAIDLPQKMLVWQDEAGAVFVSYNSPYYLGARHGLTGEDERLRMMADALANLAKAATRP